MPNGGRPYSAQHPMTACPDMVLRPVDEEDCDLILHYTNTSRAEGAGLTGSDPVPRSEHEAWFRARLDNPDHRIWIIEYRDAPVGMVRIDKEADRADEAVTPAVYIERESRRLGLASAALWRVLEETNRPAISRVHHENIKALRMNKRLGFKIVERHADHVVLKREPGR